MKHGVAGGSGFHGRGVFAANILSASHPLSKLYPPSFCINQTRRGRLRYFPPSGSPLCRCHWRNFCGVSPVCWLNWRLKALWS